MSRNTRETRLPPDLLDTEAYIALSLEARLLYITMLQLSDDEGRLVAAPAILRANGRFQGLDLGLLADRLSEVEQGGHFIQYHSGTRLFAFNPRAFDRPGGIRFWSRSACPLPPADLLERWPDYRAALARLDGHGRLTFNGEPWLDRRDGPRYPELWPGLTPIRQEERDKPGRNGTKRGRAGLVRTVRDYGGAGAGAGAGASSRSLQEIDSLGGGFDGGHRRHGTS